MQVGLRKGGEKKRIRDYLNHVWRVFDPQRKPNMIQYDSRVKSSHADSFTSRLNFQFAPVFTYAFSAGADRRISISTSKLEVGSATAREKHQSAEGNYLKHNNNLIFISKASRELLA